MPLKNENIALGLPANASYQVGVSDVDSGFAERNLLIPWPSIPLATWVYYDCTLGCMLDSGIVVHNRLPQIDNTPDTLSMCDLDDPKLDQISTGGVNLKCKDQYTDIVQRMGHSRYWFRLWGQALRLGHQIPIPSIKKIGGVPAIPYDKNPQWAFNRIAPGGNYGGIPLWHAGWSLWYTTAVPPRTLDIPAADPGAHLNGKPRVVSDIQAPVSQPDNNAVKSAPPLNSGNNANFGTTGTGTNNANFPT